jgi:hypothetical protein
MTDKLKNLICIVFAIQLIFCAGYYMGSKQTKPQNYDSAKLGMIAEAYTPIEFINAKAGE